MKYEVTWTCPYCDETDDLPDPATLDTYLEAIDYVDRNDKNFYVADIAEVPDP